MPSEQMMMLEGPIHTHRNENLELHEKEPLQASSKTHDTLPQIVQRRDLVILFVLTVVFLQNITGVQFGGASSFLYWTCGLCTFLLPCVVVTQWMMKQFPGAGGHYLWAKKVMGAQWGFISAFCAWLPCVLASISVVGCALALSQYLFPFLFTTLWLPCLCIVVFLLVAATMTCLPLSLLKRILLGLTTLYIAVFGLLGAAGVWWLMQRHALASSFSFPTAWTPTASSVGVYGIVILALLGADSPLFLSGEIRGGMQGVRRTSSFVWWGVIITFLAYVLGTFGVFVIVPASQSGGFTASIQAIQLAFGPAFAYGAALCLLLGQLAVLSTYILLPSRMLVVVATDRRLPLSITEVNRFGVPLRSIGLQALVVLLSAIFSYVLAPGIFVASSASADLALMIQFPSR